MVVDVLERSRGRPDALALISGAEVWTYAALGEAVDKRSRVLEGDGVGPGDCVPIFPESDARDVIEMLALWRRGAVVMPLNPRLTDTERGVARKSLVGAAIHPATQAILWTSGTSGRPRGVVLSFDTT